MEIVLLVAVVALVGWFFYLKTKKTESYTPVAPYKVETPVVAERSPDDKFEATAPVLTDRVEPVTASVAPAEPAKKKAKAPAKPKATKAKPAAKTAKAPKATKAK